MLAAVLVSLAVPALAQGSSAPIDVIDVTGPLDAHGIRYVTDQIQEAPERGTQAIVLQIDAAAVVGRTAREDLDDLLMVVADPPVPVIAWVGDAPAVAFGGALEVALSAGHTVAAPGVEIGHRHPTVLGHGSNPDETRTVVDGPMDGLVDDVQATIGGLIVSLDGMTLPTSAGPVTLDTAEQTTDDGEVRMRVVPEVRFLEPGLWTRTLRLALRPEAVFFFLTIGLAFAAFEFYAIGPGVAAATASVPLLLAGYGLSQLPIGWGLFLVLFAMWLMTSDYQRGGFGVLSYLATVLLGIGGFFITDTRPALPPSGWAVVLTAVGVGLFYLVAMPTVARSRFTTQTIGRDHLIGRRGRAVTDLTGHGTVDVDGAVWEAVSHRESGIAAGDEVVVHGVQGLFLEVEPPEEG